MSQVILTGTVTTCQLDLSPNREPSSAIIHFPYLCNFPTYAGIIYLILTDDQNEASLAGILPALRAYRKNRTEKRQMQLKNIHERSFMAWHQPLKRPAQHQSNVFRV